MVHELQALQVSASAALEAFHQSKTLTAGAYMHTRRMNQTKSVYTEFLYYSSWYTHTYKYCSGTDLNVE